MKFTEMNGALERIAEKTIGEYTRLTTAKQNRYIDIYDQTINCRKEHLSSVIMLEYAFLNSLDKYDPQQRALIKAKFKALDNIYQNFLELTRQIDIQTLDRQWDDIRKVREKNRKKKEEMGL